MSVTAAQLAAFVLTLSAAILSPGPGVIAVSQAAFAHGRARALPYGWGLATGAVLWCLFALLGLTVLFRVLPWTLVAMHILGGGYLLWIAWQLWHHAREPLPDAAGTGAAGFGAGLMLNLSNPKPALFYAAILLRLFPGHLGATDRAVIMGTAFAVELALYTALATLMALPFLRQRYYAAKFWIDRGAAGLIGLLGVTMILQH